MAVINALSMDSVPDMNSMLSYKWNLLEEHLLQAVHDDNTQLRGQHGPEHVRLSVVVGHPVPPQDDEVLIDLVRFFDPVPSQGALHCPQEPQLPTTQLTGQHLHEDEDKKSPLHRYSK